MIDVGTLPPLTRANLRRIDHRRPAEPRPAVPHVMVIYPGHHHSTRDVADNLVAGFTAAGAIVQPFNFHHYIEQFWPLEKLWTEEGRADATDQALLLASNAVFPFAMSFRPDLIVTINGMAFPQAAAALLGQYAPTAIVLTESPYMFEREVQVQSAYKVAFTNERTAVQRLRRERRREGHQHPKAVHYLPHAFDPQRHYPRVADGAYRSDVCFIGSPFPERQALFAGVDWSGIELVTRGLWTDPDDVATLTGPHGFVDNDEAHRFYAGARINVNHHRVIRYYGSDQTIGAGEAESLNPRVYELAAAGCFQVCDDSRAELREVFGESIPTYQASDPDSLERLVRWYLAHPEERDRCAAEAHARVQAHTAAARARRVLDICLARNESVAGAASHERRRNRP